MLENETKNVKHVGKMECYNDKFELCKLTFTGLTGLIKHPQKK